MFISIDTSYQRGFLSRYFYFFLSFFLSNSEMRILRPNIRANFLFELWEYRAIKSAFGVRCPKCLVSTILYRTQSIIPKRIVQITFQLKSTPHNARLMCANINILLLLLLPLQPSVGFSLLSDFLPFRLFLTQLSPPPYSYIFFYAFNPSFPWFSSVSPTYWFPLQYSFRYSFSFHPHHVTLPSHSFSFYKSHYICAFYLVVQHIIHSDSPESILIFHCTKDFS